MKLYYLFYSAQLLSLKVLNLYIIDFRTPNAPKGPRRAFATPSPRTRRRMAANLTPEPTEPKVLPSKTPIMAFNDPTPVSSPRHQPKIQQPRAKVREIKPQVVPDTSKTKSEELAKQVHFIIKAFCGITYCEFTCNCLHSVTGPNL